MKSAFSREEQHQRQEQWPATTQRPAQTKLNLSLLLLVEAHEPESHPLELLLSSQNPWQVKTLEVDHFGEGVSRPSLSEGTTLEVLLLAGPAMSYLAKVPVLGRVASTLARCRGVHRFRSQFQRFESATLRLLVAWPHAFQDPGLSSANQTHRQGNTTSTGIPHLFEPHSRSLESYSANTAVQ